MMNNDREGLRRRQERTDENHTETSSSIIMASRGFTRDVQTETVPIKLQFNMAD
jgi:hypothetical protein